MADSTHYSKPLRRLRFESLESRRMLSITVDTLVDENDGVGVGTGTSLREAIAAAVSGDTIDFSVTGTINLNQNSPLVINKSLTVSGPGASFLTIRAFDPTPATKNGDGMQVLLINDADPESLSTVTLTGITITGADRNFVDGAGIYTTENLTLDGCVVSDNRTTGQGGGIYSHNTQALQNTLVVRNSTITGNSAINSEGGGIRKRYGSLLIENCTISNNTAAYAGGVSGADGGIIVQVSGSTFAGNHSTQTNMIFGGGAIFCYNAMLTVSDSSITGNSAANGGGINTRQTWVTVSNSTLSNNTATTDGGAIWVTDLGVTLTDCVIQGNTAGTKGGGVQSQSSLTVTRTTISGNSATSTTSGSGGGVSSSSPMLLVDSTINNNSARYGGGIAISSFGTTQIVRSTLSGNTATFRGGGLYAVQSQPVVVSHSTITLNTAPAAGGGGVGSVRNVAFRSSVVSGNIGSDVQFTGINSNTISSQGYNIVGTGNSLAKFNQPGDQTGVTDPKLGPLAANGGPTKTHTPLAQSPAIDAGDPAAVAGMNGVPLYDQRGKPYARIWDADGVGGGRIDVGAVELQTLPLPAAVYGDYNADGVVDGGDFVLARKLAGTTVTPYAASDGSGNGSVGAEDYDVWRAHYGETYGVGSGASGEQLVVSSAVANGSEKIDDGEAVAAVPSVSAVGASVVGDVTQQARVSTGAPVLAKRAAVPATRPDALVEWARLRGEMRDDRRGAREWTFGESEESADGVGCAELDVAIGELMGNAVLSDGS